MCHNKMKTPNKLTIMMNKLQHNMQITTKQNGMTIIELMIVIAIAGVLVGLAIPSMRAILDNQRLSAANNDLISSMIIARSEAVRQKKHVTVCASADGINCNAGAAGIANWSNGWIAFANTSSTTLTRNVATEPLISVFSAPKGISSLTLTVNNGAPSLLSYRPNGALGSVASNQEKLFTVCDSRGSANASATLVSRTGRPKTQKTGFADAALNCG